MKNKFYLTRYPSDQNPKPVLIPDINLDWEAKAVFNPSVIFDGGVFKMLYRTYGNNLQLAEPRLHRPGFYFTDPVSFIGYAESFDGINFEKRNKPFIFPSESYDMFGCEDPRITKIEDIFYITYTAIDGQIGENPNVRIALATTKDFLEIKKHGIIGPDTSSKASAFFPEKINSDKIGLLMTISPDSTNSHIKIKYFNSLSEIGKTTKVEWDDFLENNKPILKTDWWLHRGPEIGATPLKTDKGWLIIFSSESMSDTWTIGAALLDLENPNILIARTPGYILQPVTDYEREGLVPNVAFPEGAVIVGEKLYVYYGAADTVIGLATCNLNELLDYILTFKS